MFLSFLNTYGRLKNDQFLVKKKAKILHKQCPAATGTTFSTKFVLGAKVQNSACRNASNLGLCRNPVDVNI